MPHLLSEQPGFALQEGGIIEVPMGAAEFFRHSYDAHANPETPMVARLKESDEQPGVYKFVAKKDGRGRVFGKIIFIPENVQAGDLIKVIWVDPNCACTVRASEEEATAFRAASK
jgi:hypothetical protein